MIIISAKVISEDFIVKGFKRFMENEGYYLWKRLTCRYYIIHRSELGAGFFSNYYWVLGHVVFARKFGYIPVVDMKNYKTLYSEDEPVNGETNAWNYYFENVGDTGLDEAYQSGKYVFGKERAMHEYSGRYSKANYRFPSDKSVAYYHPIIEKYLRIKKDILNGFEKEYQEKFVGKAIGIHVRGTDMKNDLGHPLPAKTESYFKSVKGILAHDAQVKTLFLATDEKEVVVAFEKEFRGKYLLVINDVFRSDEQDETRKTGIHEMKVENAREFHKYKMGMEVLKDAWFLSKCDYLVCGHSNITNTVILWNDNKFDRIVCVEG